MKTIKPNDVVLGYTLSSRIGSGGYGEVWSAEAPGGMMKAVKFIYGFHDEQRAKTELKSLDRIKGVRHPFLLSLERIQVVSGQLIVITELADKSLADLFREMKTASGTGIPRNELLQYMRDAADGLDYLSQSHKLQHLDIKPENLLLLSGHVKIADFGLVKEVHDATQSLMNGLTPIYAPPELFDGRPHCNSDQYSLAIVYQEMLTGTRPFAGTSPAQLAAQHLNSRPSLQSLPAKDQSVIARALSKDPALRFASCRDMIDELVERKSRTNAKRTPSALELQTDTTETPSVVEDARRRGVTSRVSAARMPADASPLVNLPPLNLSETKSVLSPTLIVGVGRTAALAVARIRQRLAQQFGPSPKTPAIGVLCLDTDAQALSKLTQPSSGQGLKDSDVLAIPLKTPQQYRQDDKMRWNWLSRRWIYNIPRSGQTEGLRPLGRLAFVDHSTPIRRRLKDLVTEITKPESIATTAETVGLDPHPHRVNVFVVASSAGGVGSGMTIDLAYAIRAVLADKGIDDIRLNAILVHVTPRGPNEQALAIANTLGLLTELRHINQYGYPGDESCELPSAEDEPVFDDVYLSHLGDGLSPQAVEEKLANVGEYVFLNIATHCQSFMDQCRANTESEIRSAQIKSFGLSQNGAFDQMSRALAEAVQLRWCDADRAKHRLRDKSVVAEIRSEQKVSLDQIRQSMIQSAAKHVESVRAMWVRDTNGVGTESSPDEALRRAEQLCQGLFAQLGLTSDVGNSHAALELRGVVETLGVQAGKQLGEQLWSLVSQPQYRLGGAIYAASSLLNEMRCELKQLREGTGHNTALQQQATNELKLIFAPNKKYAHLQPVLETWRDQYFAACVEQLASELTIPFLTKVIAGLCETESALQAAVTALHNRLAVCMPIVAAETEPKSQTESFPLAQIKSFIRAKLNDLAEQVDAHLQLSWLHDSCGLAQVILDPLKKAAQLPGKLTEACNAMISGAQRDLSLRDLATAGGMSDAALAEWMSTQCSEAMPSLADGGGGIRLMIGHSGNAATIECLSGLKEQKSQQPTLLAHAPGDFVFCQELQNIPFSQLIYRLLDGRNEVLDLIPRLHSRTDIDWMSLNQLFQMS